MAQSGNSKRKTDPEGYCYQAKKERFMLEVWNRRKSLERLYHYLYGKRVKPTTDKNKAGCEQAKPTEKGKRRLSPEEVAAGWQQPQKVAISTTCTHPTLMHTANAFTVLEVEEATLIQPERRLKEYAKPVARTDKTSERRSWSVKKKTPTNASTPTEVLSERREPPTCAAQNLAQPQRSSYFLGGKAAGQTMLYLVDTGCNTNLVSKRVFDCLPKHIQDLRLECDTHRQMADSTRLPFYGLVQIPIRIRDVKLRKMFVVSQINKDVILGIAFWARHNFKMNFVWFVFTIEERELVCTDRFGRLMASRVQTIRRTTILS